MLGDVGFAIFDGFLFVPVGDDSTPVVHPQNVGVCYGGGCACAGAGASGHLEDSMPRVRGDAVGVTPILRHDPRFFLNKLGRIPK